MQHATSLNLKKMKFVVTNRNIDFISPCITFSKMLFFGGLKSSFLLIFM